MLVNTIFTLAFCSGLASSQYLKSTYESSSSYYDRYLLDSPYNLCRDPLMRQSAVSATSEASQRTANMAFLWGGSAWTGTYKSLLMLFVIIISTFCILCNNHEKYGSLLMGTSQFENIRIFLLLRFFVKSILENLI